ncbi:hypothetical protein PLESTB_001309000 [Pleodorina starrii]|uniref:PRC-barrel domain-containing protein n=1 Tax=Pleodorina starrii TaxID=330485 RepID=A0A9W6F672_9CHLO|nr:hypothetical protein PLESTB_001309000 [Pleodorina starrii]
MALVRRPFYDPMEPAQPTFIKLSDVMDKDVISSTTGRKLGKMGEAWVDASRLEVTCFDLESSGAIGVVPLLTIKQVGDVVLVQEDGVLRQPLDPRFGFTKLLGWEVRTPNNRALGKVRDMSFSRDTGTISKIEFDDFGLRFLRADFFDRFSVPADAIRQCAYGVVSLAADNVQYQEKQGLLSTLLRRVGGTQQLAGLLADGSRGGEAAGLLPQGYSYEQWQNDVRMWEAQTGCSYEEYMMQTGQQQPFGGSGRRNALPPGRPQPQALLPEAGSLSGGGIRQPGAPNYALPPSSSAPPQGGRPGAYNPMQQQQQAQQQQMPQAYGTPGQQQVPPYGGAGGYGSGYSGPGADPRFRGPAAQPQPQPRGAPAQPPRYSAAAGPQQQQQQWPQPGAQSPVGQPQQQQQWGQQPQQQQQQPPMQQQQPPMQQQQQQMAQRPGAPGPGVPGRGPMAGGPGAGIPGAAPVPQVPQQPRPQQQQQQQPPQYGWPGAVPGPSGGPGFGPAGAPGRDAGPVPPGQNGAGGAGSTRGVEEWMTRGPQGQAMPGGYDQAMEVPSRSPTPAGPAPPTGAEPPGWDLPSAAGSRQPQPY